MADLLVCIVDACNDSWAAIDSNAAAAAEAAPGDEGGPGETRASTSVPRRCSFPEFITHLNLFFGAYSCLGRKNRLVVLGFSEGAGGYVYPRPGDISPAYSSDMLRPAAVGRACEERLARLRYGDEVVSELMGTEPDDKDSSDKGTRAGKLHNSLASCMSLALCYHHTAQRAQPALRTRMLVFSAGPDRAHHYTAAINAIFSAQRYGIPVDACILGDKPSTVLQQAADLTRGLYSHPTADQHPMLSQVFIASHLPDPATRELLLAPPAHAVDLRASCFCHRRHVDLAYVCSVCLSIWCSPRPACPVCGSDTSGLAAAAPIAPPAGVAARAPAPESSIAPTAKR